MADLWTKGYGDDKSTYKGGSSFPTISSVPAKDKEPEPKANPKQVLPTLTSRVKSTPDFFVSNRNRALLDAATTIAEQDGVAVVYAVGPSGWGKTQLGFHYAEQIGYDSIIVPATSVMEGEEWFGVRHIDKGETTFRHTEFSKALHAGRMVIVIDELSRVPPYVLNPLLSLMHDNGQFVVHNEKFSPQWETIFYITANVGHQYTGTFELDVALESRLTVQLLIDAIPRKAEVGICMAQTNSFDFVAEYAAEVIRFLRTSCPTARDASPRATLKLARALNTGIPARHVLSQISDTIEDVGERKQFTDFLNSLKFDGNVVQFFEDSN